MRILLSSIITIIFVLNACQKSPSKNEEENDCLKIAEDVIEPHAEGNYWVRLQEVYSGGQIERSDTGRIVVEKIFPVQVNSELYNVAEERVIFPGDIPNEAAALRWNGPEGLYNVGMTVPGDTMVMEPRLHYKYPVEVGESWRYPRLFYDPYEKIFFIKDTLTITCVAQNEPFITSLDTFQTMVYHYYYRPADDILNYWHFFQYLAPGIGPVGTTRYSRFDTTYIYEQRQLRELRRKLSVIDYCLH